MWGTIALAGTALSCGHLFVSGCAGGEVGPKPQGSAGDARDAAASDSQSSGDVVEQAGDGGLNDEAAPDAATVPVSCGRWDDPILAGDCSVDWRKWTTVASRFDQRDVLDYRYGPGWDYFHGGAPDAATEAPLYGAPDRGITDGWYKWHTTLPTQAIYDQGGSLWYSNSGQLLYSADAPGDPGMALARAFATYASALSGTGFWRAYDMKISWQGAGGDWYLTNPDYSSSRPPVVAANDGATPANPVAAARANVQRGMIAAVVYQDGLVVGARNDSQDAQYNAVVRLAPGKVPTAVTVTPANEFVLITVWDTTAKKAQIAVVAVQGQVCGTSDGNPVGQPGGRQNEFGLPNWGVMVAMKVVGYVDLPFAAPMSIATGTDQAWTSDARDANNQVVGSLSQQAERDAWASTADNLHVAATAGYAIVSSRAEDKVAFVDLQPLYQYYRAMYFTSQGNYEKTQRRGSAAGEWPYTFEYAPAQSPVVAAVLDVKEPTAVAAGIERVWTFAGDDTFRSRAFVGTLDGHLRVYDVGGLNTSAAADVPTLAHTQALGRNPTSITFGTAEAPADAVWITSRGDREIDRASQDGTLVATLRDRRMVDPVYAFAGQGYGLHNLAVSDFKGRQVLSYVTANMVNTPFSSDVFFHVADGKGAFEFAYATPVPGRPFEFSFCEVY